MTNNKIGSPIADGDDYWHWAAREIGFPEKSITQHVSKYSKLLNCQSEKIVPTAGKIKPLMIACTSRSGSTFLSEILLQTQAWGRPGEYLNFFEMERQIGNERIHLADYVVERIETHGSDGRIAIKGASHMLLTLAMGGLLPQALEWDWVFLTRNDVMAQAISLLIAEQTGSWQSGIEARGVPEYEFRELSSRIDVITSENMRWERFFAKAGIAPIRICYEQLQSKPENFLKIIGQRSGIQGSFEFNAEGVNVKIQRGSQNRLMSIDYHNDFKKRLKMPDIKLDST
tara:strand:+ start:4157 stop:5014 length:858 start_codon:yes stop_codon:yes gene_type:complete